MAPALALSLFGCCLVVTLAAAATFARRLDRLGARFGLPEVLVGLLTAAAADGPEVTSALAALVKGAREASVGVIVGSNVFNLAAMVGLSALLAGSVRVRRETLVVEGSVALVVTAVVIALLAGGLSALVSVVLLGCVLIPYLVLVVAGRRLATRASVFSRLEAAAGGAVGDVGQRGGAHAGVDFATYRQVSLMAVDLLLIVGGSVGMVQSALSLGDRWGVRPALVGVLVLAPLTSLPNALTGVRLGLAGRGSALVSEVLNSNTINLVVGIAVPALFVTLTAHSRTDSRDLVLLAVMTVAALALLAPPVGVRRLGGVTLLLVYVVFVAVQLV